MREAGREAANRLATVGPRRGRWRGAQQAQRAWRTQRTARRPAHRLEPRAAAADGLLGPAVEDAGRVGVQVGGAHVGTAAQRLGQRGRLLVQALAHLGAGLDCGGGGGNERVERGVGGAEVLLACASSTGLLPCAAPAHRAPRLPTPPLAPEATNRSQARLLAQLPAASQAVSPAGAPKSKASVGSDQPAPAARVTPLSTMFPEASTLSSPS